MENAKINIAAKFELFHETWTPKIIGRVDDKVVKLAKLKGEFVWHTHADEDELFLVWDVSLTIHMRDRDVHLSEGDMYIVPAGVEHKPSAPEGAAVVLFESCETKHTGEIVNERTVADQQWI